MIIVIDGLSGSGKSSTAKAVAEKLGIEYLDSGALYRAASWIWLDENKPDSLADRLSSRKIDFAYRNNRFYVQIDGVDISDAIRTQRISDVVSHVSADPEVRRYVNDLMRKAVDKGSYIADGRDLGSTVFPDADLKFYMEASLDVRACRRYKEMIEAGESVTLEQVRSSMASRDDADSHRTASPLVKPDDAHVLDTSEKTFEEQVNEISSIIQKKLLTNKP